MVSRTRRKWKPDSRGYYTRQIGWVVSKSGNKQQQKFLLGKDRREAEFRERKLRELWDRFATSNSVEEGRPLWPESLLDIAKLIAKGVEEIAVALQANETQISYADRIRRLQAIHPVVLFVPEDSYLYDVGVAALNCLEQVPATVPAFGEPGPGRKNGPKTVVGRIVAAKANRPSSAFVPPMEPPTFAKVLAHETRAQVQVNGQLYEPTQRSDHSTNGGGQIPTTTRKATLHEALGAYQKFIKREFHRPELDRLTDWGQTQIRQLKTLKDHHADCLLAQLNSDQVNELIGYWRRRPLKKGTKDPMKAKSAGNYLSALIRFLKWLHNSGSFNWVKPFALSDANTRVQRLPSDYDNRQLEQVDVFSLDELKLLMRYAQPLDRLFLLLALNCGFGRAEISSLLVKEARLFEAHSAWHQELLNFESTNDDSFVKRIRRKSGVYGEHILYPMTVQGIQWAIERREQQPGFSDDARLLLNSNGKSFDHPTKSGNANQTIPNRLGRLIKRIKDDGNEIRSLSFGKVRKTAGQLIKTFSDGEIMGVFDCHGKPVKSDSLNDAYSNRPFGRVFEAIREVEKYLEPVFKEAGSAPFARQAEAYTKRSTIERIISLREAGESIERIAADVGVSASAVSQHIHRQLEQSRLPLNQ